MGSQRGKRQKTHRRRRRSVRINSLLVTNKEAIRLLAARINASLAVRDHLVKGRVELMILRSDLVVEDSLLPTGLKSQFVGWGEEILTKISACIATKIAVSTAIIGVTIVVKMAKCFKQLNRKETRRRKKGRKKERKKKKKKRRGGPQKE